MPDSPIIMVGHPHRHHTGITITDKVADRFSQDHHIQHTEMEISTVETLVQVQDCNPPMAPNSPEVSPKHSNPLNQVLVEEVVYSHPMVPVVNVDNPDQVIQHQDKLVYDLAVHKEEYPIPAQQIHNDLTPDLAIHRDISHLVLSLVDQ